MEERSSGYCPWGRKESGMTEWLHFTSLHCILDSLVDYDGYSISLKGFLPTVVNIMIIWVKFTHSSPSWRGQWHPTPVLLPGKSHGWRSLVGSVPWGRYESVTTEWLHFHFSLSCIGEGNGNPLQCSCLENPRDGGAWWAAVCGVTQSRIRLKWLSSSG